RMTSLCVAGCWSPRWEGVVDVSAGRSAPTVREPGVPRGPSEGWRPAGRRRPSGQPPPLPHHVQTTGVGGLAAAVVLGALSVLVFGGGVRGSAVAVTAIDDAVVRWLSGLQAPGLLPV